MNIIRHLLILGYALVAYLAYAEEENSIVNIQGKWKYIDCSYKNTSVDGVLVIKDNTIAFDGRIHEDFPTKPYKGMYRYQLDGKRLNIIYREGQENPPVAEYIFLDEEYLYFSTFEIDKIIQATDPRYEANWVFKLQRQDGN